jgi:hypothetical protein
MRNRSLSSLLASAMALTLGLRVNALADAPSLPPNSCWQYTLLPGSRLIDNCFVCGRPDIVLPLRGTFLLRLISENPLFATYAWESISWTAGTPGGSLYKVVGKGAYQVGGEVALVQDLSVEIYYDNGWTNRLCDFTITNDVRTVQRLWPTLQVSVDQTNGLPVQQLHLDLFAAPFHELWFSTKAGFHAGTGQPPAGYVSPGDLISSAGRVVKRNNDLTRFLGIMPVVQDLGLDGVDILAGGEIAFSVEQDIFSETLGDLHHGDVLSDRGRVMTNYAALIGAFGPEPPPIDQGLDGLCILPNREIYFSVTADFFSERLGRSVRRGDLLSSSGVIIKSNEELVARFNPADAKQDYGLDAFYIWPSGEIWFSVETGFYGQHFEPYEPGDLLSDQGYVVYRNLDLLEAFAPVEEPADFGLDALFVVSDASPPAAAPRLLPERLQVAQGAVLLNWAAQGRVFQVEKAADVLGPWLPASPITPDLQFTDALTGQAQAFYRIRQW